MQSIQIISSIENKSAGPSYSVVRLAEALAARNVDSSLMSLAEGKSEGFSKGVKYQYFRADAEGSYLPTRLAPSRDLNLAVSAAARKGALLHVHGLWRMPNVYPGLAASRAGSPLVLSPRGMLGSPALAFSKRQKKMFWHIWQRRSLRALDCIHVTARSELEDIRSFGLSAPAAIIPNGIDVPVRPSTAKKQKKLVKQVLYLGRIHPKKGIDRLLQAWSLVNGALPNWELRIVGPSEFGHTEELQAMARHLKLGNVRFDGPIYGAERDEAYANADLFALPTRHENFGMVVAEALAQGTPVISTKGAPWKGLVSESCGWWTDHGHEALAAAMTEGMMLSNEERERMGMRGRDWMRRDFSWDAIALKMESVYLWCAGRGERPECVVG